MPLEVILIKLLKQPPEDLAQLVIPMLELFFLKYLKMLHN